MVRQQETDVLIVGAGPTGLGAAWRLNELAQRHLINPDLDWLLTEKSPIPGGMAASVTDAEGFNWDLGGHIIYSHYEYFDAVLADVMGDDLLQHPRKSWVWMADRFFPFPIQHNLRHLPAEDLARCLRGLVDTQLTHRNGRQPANFAEWLDENFGTALSELFFLPYNRKMWAFPADEMSTVWTQRKSGSRYANVPLVDIARLVENVVAQQDDPGWVGATTFPYPKRGGIGELWRRVFDRLPPNRTGLSEQLVAVDPVNRVATFASGLEVSYQHMINTSPMPELLRAMPPGSSLHHETTPLRHSCTHSVGIGLRGTMPETLKDKYWIYVPDPAAPYFRVTLISNFSRSNAPEGEHWSLMCECSGEPNTIVDEDELFADIERALRASLLTPDQEIVSRWYRKLNYGYPVPCLNRDAFLQEVEPQLRQHNIRSRGRFGGWKYETSNQDNAFMQGVEAVDSILLGTEEISYFHLDLIAKGAVQRSLPDWEPRRTRLQMKTRSAA